MRSREDILFAEARAPVHADGRQLATLQGDAGQLARDFLAIIDDFVERRFGR